MKKARYIPLSVMVFGCLFASAGVADQTGQNAPKSANQAKSTVVTRHGSGTIGGAAKNKVTINGTTIPARLRH